MNNRPYFSNFESFEFVYACICICLEGELTMKGRKILCFGWCLMIGRIHKLNQNAEGKVNYQNFIIINFIKNWIKAGWDPSSPFCHWTDIYIFGCPCLSFFYWEKSRQAGFKIWRLFTVSSLLTCLCQVMPCF